MSLTGVWTSELRSVMLLREGADHGLTGVFHSLVGRDSGSRTLAGRTSSEEDGKQMVGFAVSFEIASPMEGYGHFSVCSWSGWAEKDELGRELIKTHWLLSVSMLDKTRDWAATNVGQDVFLKVSNEPDERFLNDLDALKALRAKITSKRA
jgi:Avidin family